LPEKLKKERNCKYISNINYIISAIENIKVFVKSNLDDWPLYNQITSSYNDPI